MMMTQNCVRTYYGTTYMVIVVSDDGGGGEYVIGRPDGTREMCWEYVSWSDMTTDVQKWWNVLGQSAAMWSSGNEPSYPCWDEMTLGELNAAAELGYTEATWDWGSGCDDGYYYGGWYYY